MDEGAAVPGRSYTIWFSQRTGSTLLATALEATGVAGRPREWFDDPGPEGLLAHYGARTVVELRDELWRRGTTSNGVYGAKVSFYEPRMGSDLALLQQLPGVPAEAPRPAVWEHAFPNHRHIFMTRRNKVRLAVSWWRAIQSAEWHRVAGRGGAAPSGDAYDFDAINHLYAEAGMREAGLQAFFAEAAIVPLTVVYEDFILTYEATVRRVLTYIGVDPEVTVPPPAFERISDGVSEAWVQRFREERQRGWKNRGW